jgi:hypothetical protein
MKLGLSTMTRNQGTRLKEWVIYHNNLGVDKFIIFLDNCTDDSQSILSEIKNIDIDVYLTSEIKPNQVVDSWILRSHKMYNFTLENYSDLDLLFLFILSILILICFCVPKKLLFLSFDLSLRLCLSDFRYSIFFILIYYKYFFQFYKIEK